MIKHKGPSPSADLAIITNDTPQVECLTDLSLNDKPWDYHKKLSETVSHHYFQSSDDGFIKYGKRILFCAPILEFGWVVAEQMAVEVKTPLSTTWGLSITGIAGSLGERILS